MDEENKVLADLIEKFNKRRDLRTLLEELGHRDVRHIGEESAVYRENEAQLMTTAYLIAEIVSDQHER